MMIQKSDNIEDFVNTLYYGDCSDVMARFPPNSIDLIYLDPPFNSNTNYNVLFGDAKDNEHTAQYEAFTDTWSWSDAAQTRYSELSNAVGHELHGLVTHLHGLLGDSGMMAYLIYMADRLLAMRELLKDTGSICLHCDSTANSHLNIVMKSIFGGDNFVNEIVWERIKGAGKQSQYEIRSFGRSTDTILIYSRSETYKFYADAVAVPYPNIEKEFPHCDKRGRFKRRSPFRPPGLGPRPNLCYEYKGVYPPHNSGWTVSKSNLVELDNAGEIEWVGKKPWRKQRPANGIIPNNLWTDIKPPGKRERTGFQTQKPVALLERIINAFSKKGDIVMDPFCGCGTTIDTAIRTGRKWIGIDISIFAIKIIRDKRLKNTDVRIDGIPTDMASARQLAADKPLQFESWAISLVPGLAPNKKKTGDKGIDGRGILVQKVEDFKKNRLVLAQVKGGQHVPPGHVRDFCHVIEREKAVAGVFITLETMKNKSVPLEPRNFALGANKYPRLLYFSVEDYFKGIKQDVPPMLDPLTGKQYESDWIADEGLFRNNGE